MPTNLGALAQLCFGGGGALLTKHACVGSTCSGWTTRGLPQRKAACASQVQAAQAPGCTVRAQSQWAVHFLRGAAFPFSLAVLHLSLCLQGEPQTAAPL
mgnify:CR=1 FL=1